MSCLRCDESFLLYTAKRIYPDISPFISSCPWSLRRCESSFRCLYRRSNDALLSKSVLLLEGCLLIVRIRGTAVIGSTVQVFLRRYPAFAILPLTAIIHAIFVVFSRIEVRLNIDFFIVCIGRTRHHVRLEPSSCWGVGGPSWPFPWERYPTLQAHSPEVLLVALVEHRSRIFGDSASFCTSSLHVDLVIIIFMGWYPSSSSSSPRGSGGVSIGAFEHCLRRRQKGICSLSLGSSGGSSAHKLRIDHGVIRRVVESDRVCFLSSSGLFASSPDADTFLDVFVIVPQPSQVGDRKVYKTLHTSGIGNPLGIMTEKSALRLIWLLLRIFSARSCETCVLAMWTRPISILHDYFQLGCLLQQTWQGLCVLYQALGFFFTVFLTRPSSSTMISSSLCSSSCFGFAILQRASCEEDSFELR
ncbi:hypothetical protein KCU87_g81, partial [Aureobasidium melanogenum]